MSKFPIEMDDDEGQADAINYLLSGPSGLGQNFAGFSTYTPAYLTGNFRIPFTKADAAELYVAPIALSKAEMLDGRTYKYTFASTQATVPFSLGNGLSISGFTNVNYDNYPTSLTGRNRTLIQIGVIECTTDYVIIRSTEVRTIEEPEFATGSIFYTSMENLTSTDCDVRVTVTGATDRVFIAAQLDQYVSYEVSSGTADLTVYVDISRYSASINNDPVNPDYIFDNLYTVTEKVYTFSGLSGTGTLDLIETVFATVLDEPDPGYYRYILEVYFEGSTSDIQVTEDLLELRSISSQVVKQ